MSGTLSGWVGPKMAASPDYYSLLNHACSALEKNTPDAREGVYYRERKALVDQLRARGATDEEVVRERGALTTAFNAVEELQRALTTATDQRLSSEPSSKASHGILGRALVAIFLGLATLGGVGVLAWGANKPGQEPKSAQQQSACDILFEETYKLSKDPLEEMKFAKGEASDAAIERAQALIENCLNSAKAREGFTDDERLKICL
jgi:hypothetical protein